MEERRECSSCCHHLSEYKSSHFHTSLCHPEASQDRGNSFHSQLHRTCRVWSKPFSWRQVLRAPTSVPYWLHFCTQLLQGCTHGMVWGLEGTLKFIQFQTSGMGRDTSHPARTFISLSPPESSWRLSNLPPPQTETPQGLQIPLRQTPSSRPTIQPSDKQTTHQTPGNGQFVLY